MDKQKSSASIKIPKKFFRILVNAIDNKIYGSLEIYFENGKITQITERIINKFQKDEQEEVTRNRKEATTKKTDKSTEINQIIGEV